MSLKILSVSEREAFYYLSSYVGDMADIRTVKALEESVKRMCELLEATPRNVVCDMHPKYNTVAFAEGLDLPLKKSPAPLCSYPILHGRKRL